MGIFNNAKSLQDDQSASKVNFGVFLSNYATKQQFKSLRQDMELYLHRHQELNNTMNRPLDMGGNEIINLGNPNKPNDAVSRRFVYRKIQDIIGDYKLDDIESIKQTLKTENENIKQLTKDIASNGRKIIELHNKIENEFETITNTMAALDKTDDEIKEALRLNINIIANQIRELKDSMIKHEELKNQLNETEKKLKNSYKLEINEKIDALKMENDETNNRLLDALKMENDENNNKLLNAFLSRFAEYKSELEKTASERGDKHDTSVEILKEKVESLSNELTKQKNSFQNSISTLNINLSELSNKVEALETTMDFVRREIINNTDTIERYNNEQEQRNLVFEKSIIDLDKLTKNILPKQMTDISGVVLNLVNDGKTFKRKLSKLDKVIYEIPVFELYNNRVQEIQILSASQGLPTKYRKITNELQVDDSDFFSLFGLSSSPVIKYTDYLKPNHKFEIKRGVIVMGFQAEKQGRYIFEINLIAKGNIKGFNLYWTSGRSDRGARREFIKKDTEEEFILELDPNMYIFIYPEIADVNDDAKFTIETQSYVKVTYSWKYI